MILFICIIGLFILSIISCDEEVPQFFDISRKIIGGSDCSTEKYPFVVSIRTASYLEHFCGGSLLTESWVITAAHCIPSRNPYFYVAIAGTSKFNYDGIQRRRVNSLLIHPKYNRNAKGHDIALMHLREPFNLSTNLVASIDLPSSELEGEVRDYCVLPTVIGWGHRNRWDPKVQSIDYVFDPILQCVTIPVLKDEQCMNMVDSPLVEYVVCAYFQNGSRDACQGDSGGPLFCNGTLYGLVSFGYGCALVNKPGFYTRVDKYLAFIRYSMANYRDVPLMDFTSGSISLLRTTFNVFDFILILLWLKLITNMYLEEPLCEKLGFSENSTK